MADPTKYKPHFNYSGWEAAGNKRPKPGADLDTDFADIARSIDETIDALKDLRRSDGKLKNGIVTVDSLSLPVKAALDTGFDFGVVDELAVKAANLADLTNLKEARSNLGEFATVADVQNSHIPAVLESIRVLGRQVPGDGGGGVLVESVASDPGAFQDAAARWWRPSAAEINARAFGAAEDSSKAADAIAAADGRAVYYDPNYPHRVDTYLTHNTGAHNGLAGAYVAGTPDEPTPSRRPILLLQKHSAGERDSDGAPGSLENGLVVAIRKTGGDTSSCRGIYAVVERDTPDDPDSGSGIGVHGRAISSSPNGRIWGGWFYADAQAALNRTIGIEINVKNDSGIDPGPSLNSKDGDIDGLVVATADSGIGIGTHAIRISRNTAAGWWTGLQVAPPIHPTDRRGDPTGRGRHRSRWLRDVECQGRSIQLRNPD